MDEDSLESSKEESSSFDISDLEKTSEYVNMLNQEDRDIDIMAKTAVLYDMLGITDDR